MTSKIYQLSQLFINTRIKLFILKSRMTYLSSVMDMTIAREMIKKAFQSSLYRQQVVPLKFNIAVVILWRNMRLQKINQVPTKTMPNYKNRRDKVWVTKEIFNNIGLNYKRKYWMDLTWKRNLSWRKSVSRTYLSLKVATNLTFSRMIALTNKYRFNQRSH